MSDPLLSGLVAAVAVGEIDRAIVDAEERLRAAQLAGDAEALDQLIADDLLFTGPDGRLGTKQQDLEAHRSGIVRFRSHEPEELRARALGANAVATSLRTRIEVEVAGTMIRATACYTRVWIREDDGRWRVAAGHVSDAPAAPGMP